VIVPERTPLTLTLDSWRHTFVGFRNFAKKWDGDPKVIVNPVETEASQTEAGFHDVEGKINNAALALPPFAFKMMKSDCS
jgi:hypothetical protein